MVSGVSRIRFLVVPNIVGAAPALFQGALCCIVRGKGMGCAPNMVDQEASEAGQNGANVLVVTGRLQSALL